MKINPQNNKKKIHLYCESCEIMYSEIIYSEIMTGFGRSQYPSWSTVAEGNIHLIYCVSIHSVYGHF